MREASQYLHIAGVEAARLSAPQEALRYFEQAMELAQEAEDRILADRARLLLGLFRGSDAARDYERLLAGARSVGDKPAELEAMLGLARANYILSLDSSDSAVISRSRDLSHAAIELAREIGDRSALVRALVPTQWFSDFWPEYRPRAEAQVREAHALALELGDGALIVDSTMALFRFESTRENIRVGEELLERLLEDRDLLRTNALLFRLMFMHLEAGNFAQCIARCDQGIALAAETGAPPVQYPTLKSMALARTGRSREAWDSVQDEIADDEHPFGRAFQRTGMATYYFEIRAWQCAVECLRVVDEEAPLLGRAWLNSGPRLSYRCA